MLLTLELLQSLCSIMISLLLELKGGIKYGSYIRAWPRKTGQAFH